MATQQAATPAVIATEPPGSVCLSGGSGRIGSVNIVGGKPFPARPFAAEVLRKGAERGALQPVYNAKAIRHSGRNFRVCRRTARDCCGRPRRSFLHENGVLGCEKKRLVRAAFLNGWGLNARPRVKRLRERPPRPDLAERATYFVVPVYRMPFGLSELVRLFWTLFHRVITPPDRTKAR